MIKQFRIWSDLDGTLSDDHWRQPHIESGNWELYYQLMTMDAPILPVLQFLKDALDGEHALTFATGRPSRYRPQTEMWLEKHLGPELRRVGYTLRMRGPEVEVRQRPDGKYLVEVAQLKRGWAEAARRAGASPQLVFEDDPACISAYESLGLIVVDARQFTR